MKFAEFKEDIKSVYTGKFPRSTCKVIPFKCIGNSLYIDCYLAGDIHECSHGIAGNDMFKISLCVNLPDNFNFETDELPEILTMEAKSNCYIIKPESRYMYCDMKKVSYRKSSGNAEKLVKVFEKFVDRLYNSVIEDMNNGNIHENHIKLLKQKI